MEKKVFNLEDRYNTKVEEVVTLQKKIDEFEQCDKNKNLIVTGITADSDEELSEKHTIAYQFNKG